jgi:hypothetical protein
MCRCEAANGGQLNQFFEKMGVAYAHAQRLALKPALLLQGKGKMMPSEILPEKRLTLHPRRRRA